MPSKPLRRRTVIVAGAGFAGLAAARALTAAGASVEVFEARERVGGRVWTIRDGFARGQHAEGGADLVESTQEALVELIRDLGLSLAPIVREGFGYYGADAHGRLRRQAMGRSFAGTGPALHDLVRAYRQNEHRWDGPIARRLAGQSVAEWMRATNAPEWLRHRLRGLRGLFLADPEDLSLLALVDFIADLSDDGGGRSRMLRVREGNDRIATTIAGSLGARVHLSSIVRRVKQTDTGAVVTIEAGRLSEHPVDYVVLAIPASTARDVTFDPPLPDAQQDAIGALRYGCATRLLVQFDRRFWARRGHPNAFASDQPFGAFWDGNEEQRGPAGILSFLAGGGASAELRDLIGEGALLDLPALTTRLAWLGRPARVLASRTIVWERDPWARGGYAYFDPAFDPAWRDLLARPHGRVLFAGEHTSVRWQGYMNGAVESGQRAAAEILALES